MNPDQNPYLAMIGKSQSQAPQGGVDQGGTVGPQAMGGKKPMPVPADQQNPADFQVTADNMKPLTSALSSLHAYLGAVTDPNKVKIARQILILLIQLMGHEQQTAPTESPQQAPVQ